MKKIKVSLLLTIVYFSLFNSCVTNKTTLISKKENQSYLNYYRYAAKADSLYVLKQYFNSFTTLDTIFKRLEPLNTFRFKEYHIYVKLKKLTGKEEVTKKELSLLISKYGVTDNNFKYDSTLYPIYKKKISNLEYERLRDIYKSSLDLALREEIATMVEEDQKYRTYYDGKDYKQKLKEIDSINEKRMITLFDKGIYPSRQLVGNLFLDDNNPDIELLLLHTKDSIRINYFLPKIKNFIAKGKCNPYIYAMLIDQLHLYNGKPQLYGTYNLESIKTSKYQEYNKNRNKLGIGLPSIQFDIWWSVQVKNLR